MPSLKPGYCAGESQSAQGEPCNWQEKTQADSLPVNSNEASARLVGSSGPEVIAVSSGGSITVMVMSGPVNLDA